MYARSRKCAPPLCRILLIRGPQITVFFCEKEGVARFVQNPKEITRSGDPTSSQQKLNNVDSLGASSGAGKQAPTRAGFVSGDLELTVASISSAWDALATLPYDCENKNPWC